MHQFDDGDGIVTVYAPGEYEPSETLQQQVARLRRTLSPPTRDPILTRILRAIF
jgi:hypothetical protein